MTRQDRQITTTLALVFVLVIGILALGLALDSPAATPCADGCHEVVAGGIFVLGCRCDDPR